MGALIAAGHAAHTASGGARGTSLLIPFVLGVIVGLYFGRKRGLKHLSEVQFNSNWASVRKHRPF